MLSYVRVVMASLILTLAFVSSVHAEPLTLIDAYQKALEHDTRLKLADADRQITKADVGLARAQLRPNLRVVASKGRNTTESQVPGYFGTVTSKQNYNTVGYNISLRQPLLNVASIAGYQQSKQVAAQYDALYLQEGSSLIVRVVEAYCNVLYADDNVRFSQSRIEATSEQLHQAEMHYQKGIGTLIEVNEAKAAYDLAIADGVDSANSIEYSRRKLEELIGVFPAVISPLRPDKLDLEHPQPQSVAAWIEMAKNSNQGIIASGHEVKASEKEIFKQKASRLPTIDFVAGRSYSDSETNYTIGSIYDTYSIGVQASMPIYTGGYIASGIRAAKAKKMRAEQQYNQQEQQVVADVRKYYNGVVVSIAQIKAYEQAEKSQVIVLTGTQKGYNAGLRTTLDVLNALQKLYESRRSLAQARYQLILNRLMLKSVAGSLISRDVISVDELFK